MENVETVKMSGSLKRKIALAVIRSYFIQMRNEFGSNNFNYEVFLKSFLPGNDFKDALKGSRFSRLEIEKFFSSFNDSNKEAGNNESDPVLSESLRGKIALTIFRKHVYGACSLVASNEKLNLQAYISDFVACSDTLGFSEDEVTAFLGEIFKEYGYKELPAPQKKSPLPCRDMFTSR